MKEIKLKAGDKFVAISHTEGVEVTASTHYQVLKAYVKANLKKEQPLGCGVLIMNLADKRQFTMTWEAVIGCVYKVPATRQGWTRPKPKAESCHEPDAGSTD